MRIFFFFCALGISLWGYSQSTYHSLKGRVLDLTDQNPMSGAAVQLLGTDKTAITDLEGRFLMVDIVPGKYRVRIIHPFCEPLEAAVDLTQNRAQEFFIEHHIHLLDEVMVQASVLQDPNAGNSAQKIQGAQIERAQGGSIGDLISQISGVSSLKTGNNVVKPIIHGLHSSRVAMMLNGVRIQDQEWGAEHAPMVDLSALSAVTVVKGAQALRYSGDALGGVVIAQSTRPVHQDTLWGKVQTSFQDNGRGYQSSVQLNRSRASGWFSSMTAGFQKQGDLEAPDYLLTNTAMEQKSWSGQWGWKQTDFGFSAYGSWIGSDLGILAASHLSGAEDQFRALSAQQPLIIREFDYVIDAPRQAVGHGLARIDGYYRHPIWGTISGQIDYQFNQRKEFDARRGSLKGTPALDLTLQSFNANLHVKNTTQKQTTIEYGLVVGNQSNESNPGTGVKRLIPDYQSQQYAGYLLGSQPLSDQWIIDTGVRLDHQAIKGYKYYRTGFWDQRQYGNDFSDWVVWKEDQQMLTRPQLNYTTWSGSLGLHRDAGRGWEQYLNISRASRAPNPAELFSEGLHHSAASIELGDIRFNPEIAHKISLTWTKKTGKTSFDIHPYAQWIDGFMLLVPTGAMQTIRGHFQVWEYRQTQASIWGIDLDAGHQWNEHWRSSHQVSWLRGTDTTRDEPLMMMPPPTINNQLAWNKGAWSWSLEHQWTAEQTRFPSYNISVFIPTENNTVDVDLSTPPGAYGLWHTRLEYQVNKPGKIEPKVGLSIRNATNLNYRNYLNRLRFYADDLGRSIQLYSILKF